MKWLRTVICTAVFAAMVTPLARGDDKYKPEEAIKSTLQQADQEQGRKDSHGPGDPCKLAEGERSPKLEHSVGKSIEEANSKVDVQLWALVIGISRYSRSNSKAIKNLDYADNDALEMYGFLRSKQGGGFPESNVKLLLNENATKKNVLEELGRLKRARPQDYFVIYIASHGMLGPSQKNPDEKAPYFLLHDTDPRDLPRTAIDMRLIREMINAKELPKKGLVICDTCHSGALITAGSRGEELSIKATNEFINQVNKMKEGVGFLLAAGQLIEAKELHDLKHGVFTFYLLQALRGKADFNKDRMVSFCEVKTYLINEVPKKVRDQQPVAHPNSIDADYLPLSIVSYGETEVEPRTHSTLMIRNPDFKGVKVKIDGKNTIDLEVGINNFMVTLEPHELEFSINGSVVGKLPITPDSEDFRPVALNFRFSTDDSSPTGEQPKTRRPQIFDLPAKKELTGKAQALYDQAVESFTKQRFQDALKKLDAAIIENKGRYFNALVYRGRALQSLQRHAEAVSSFEEALRLRSSDYQTETLLLEARFDSGVSIDKNEIIDELKEIISRHDYFYARVILGDVLLSMNDLAGAELELRKAILDCPGSPASYMILANILLYMDDNQKREDAIIKAKEALKLFEKIAKKDIVLKNGSLSHLIFGGGRYINEAALAEANYILAKAHVHAVNLDLTHPNRSQYLAEASKYLDEAKTLAQKNSLKKRLALVYMVSAQRDNLAQDTAGAINNGELALKLGDTWFSIKTKCSIRELLSRAYEGNQDDRKNLPKAIEHLQKYVDTCGSIVSQEELDKAKSRLIILKTRLADRKR